MSISREFFDRISIVALVPPCPACSIDRATHPELASDIWAFPAWHKGRHSGQTMMWTGCKHAEAIPTEDRTVQQCEEAWAEWCQTYFARQSETRTGIPTE